MVVGPGVVGSAVVIRVVVVGSAVVGVCVVVGALVVKPGSSSVMRAVLRLSSMR